MPKAPCCPTRTGSTPPHIDPMGALPEPSLRTHILGWGHQLAAQLKKLAEHKQGLEPEEITYHQFIELTRQLNTTRTVIHDLAQPEEHQSPNLVIAARYNLTRIASLALGMLDADEVHPLSKRCGDPDLANRLSAMRRDARDVPDARDPTPWTYLYENARPDFDQLIALCHDKTIVRELRAKAEAAAGRRLMRQSFQSQHRTLIEQAKNSMSKVAQGPQHESDVLATLQIVGLFAQISQQTSAFLGMSIVAGTRIAWSPAAVALADRTASSRQWAIGISKRELERLRRSIDATAQRAAGPADWLAQHLHGPLDTAQEHRPQDAAQPPPQTPPDTSTDPDRPDPEQKDTPTPKFEGSPSSPIDESQRIASKLHDTVRRMPNTLRARINRQLRQTAERDGTAPTPIAWHLLQGSGTARRVRHLLSRNIRTGADDPAIADAIRTGTPLPPTVSASLEALWTLSAGALNRAGEPPGAPAALVSDTEAMLAHLADIERAHEGSHASRIHRPFPVGTSQDSTDSRTRSPRVRPPNRACHTQAQRAVRTHRPPKPQRLRRRRDHDALRSGLAPLSTRGAQGIRANARCRRARTGRNPGPTPPKRPPHRSQRMDPRRRTPGPGTLARPGKQQAARAPAHARTDATRGKRYARADTLRRPHRTSSRKVPPRRSARRDTRRARNDTATTATPQHRSIALTPMQINRYLGLPGWFAASAIDTPATLWLPASRSTSPMPCTPRSADRDASTRRWSSRARTCASSTTKANATHASRTRLISFAIRDFVQLWHQRPGALDALVPLVRPHSRCGSRTPPHKRTWSMTTTESSC